MSQLMDSALGGGFDRLPPHSIEAEMCLLASMMLDKEMVGEVVQIVDREAFYQADHQIIFDVLVKLYEQNRPIDAVIVREELIKRGLYEEVGGREYLAAILGTVPSAAHGAHYAGIVREKSLLRQLISASNDILRDAYAPHEQADIVLDKAEKKIFDIAQNKVGNAMTPMEDVLHEVFEMIENRGQRGLETGFFELDDMLNGLQNGEMIIVAARPSMGKCLAADSEVVLHDGTVATIEEIARARAARLLTLGSDGKLVWTEPSAFVDDGVKPVYRVTTRLGRSVECTLAHPFLTIDGWKRLGELAPGIPIAVPRTLPAFGEETMPDGRIKVLAYLIGDGCLTDGCPEFTNSSPRLRQDFIESLAAFPGVKARTEDSNGARTPTVCVASDRVAIRTARLGFAERMNAALRASHIPQRRVAAAIKVSPAAVWQWTQGVAAPGEAAIKGIAALCGVAVADLAPDGASALSKNARNSLTRWLDELGLSGRGAGQKFVPAPMFRLPRRSLALFLNRLFATDGWATVLASGQAQLGYATVSERLARQVQHLLLRFGVVASLRHRSVSYHDSRRTAWQIDITDARSIMAFVEGIGIFGKEDALARIGNVLTGRRYQTNRDLVPKEVWAQILEVKSDLAWREVSRRLGHGPSHSLHVGTRALTRDRLRELADVLDSRPLRLAADSDVYWDRIVSIEFVGNKQVYDLTIPETHNFVANDVCVHNTAIAMNIIEHISADSRLPTAVFSLEMSKQQLAQRMLCSRGQIDAHKLRKGLLQSHEYAHLANVVGELAKAPIWVDDSPGLTVLELRAKARRLKLQHDIKCIMVDYMQLMDNPGPDSRQQQISEISRGVKAVARELSIPVICLSQLNRASEGRDGHRPRMSDLRESGSIEQDADVIALLHREDYYRMSEPDFQPDNIAEVIIAKQRNGPTGTVKLTFVNKTTRFENLSTQNDPF